jgi:hypothetical protein
LSPSKANSKSADDAAQDAHGYPVLQYIDTIKAPGGLLAEALRPQFRAGDFSYAVDFPPQLLKALKHEGYAPAEPQGILFASHHGVSLHTDDQPSVLWALGGCGGDSFVPQGESHQFLVGDQAVYLQADDVYLFDATRRHGVIAAQPGLWIVFSGYIRKV